MFVIKFSSKVHNVTNVLLIIIIMILVTNSGTFQFNNVTRFWLILVQLLSLQHHQHKFSDNKDDGKKKLLIG